VTLSIHIDSPPATLVARELTRGAVVIARCGYSLALAETLVCESRPEHRDTDWAWLAARRTGGNR
jgi:hypothetical protein